MTNILAKKAAECSRDEIDTFEHLVRKGGEVPTEGLRDHIKRAAWLVFLFEDNEQLAGIAALKHPRERYKERVFKKAGSQEDPKHFTLEAGWIFVEKSFRGRHYSRLLLEATLNIAEDQQVYATTRENNEPMKRTNLWCGFRQSGHAYPSAEGNYDLILYTKQPLL